MISDFLSGTHPEWHEILTQALLSMDRDYLLSLKQNQNYLPSHPQIFSAFNNPLATSRYILFGESPYPRINSANGYAFWDAAVGSLWSNTGFSRQVNRATSLRNLLKMLLHARGHLTTDFSQKAIAMLDTTDFHQSADAFFNHLLKQGFVLLNASLVYEANHISYHARHWIPFMTVILDKLYELKPEIRLILLGQVAKKIPGHQRFDCLIAEHPYNISFITNQDVIDFFKPLDLLNSDKQYNNS